MSRPHSSATAAQAFGEFRFRARLHAFGKDEQVLAALAALDDRHAAAPVAGIYRENFHTSDIVPYSAFVYTSSTSSWASSSSNIFMRDALSDSESGTIVFGV